jgi:predicted nuclease with TOPRIM domain
MAEPNSSLAEIAGGAFVALIAVALGLQKVIKGWKADNAESSIISMMRAELERMSNQNTRLSEELNKLQLELVTLNTELSKLTIENQHLHQEVVRLTSEVSKLKSLIPDTKG